MQDLTKMEDGFMIEAMRGMTNNLLKPNATVKMRVVSPQALSSLAD